MKTPRRVLQVLDNFLHVTFWTWAIVGAFGVQDSWYGQHQGLVAVGMLSGIITSPMIRRRIRPWLKRRWPSAFEDGPGQSPFVPR